MQQKWQGYYSLAQIIDNSVDELDSRCQSRHWYSSISTWWKHRWNNAMPHPVKYDHYDPGSQNIQGLYDIGAVMNNEAPVFMDSVQIT